MRSVASILMLAPLALPALAPNVECQLLASEPGTVSQTVDGTKVTVTYHRPRARGRTGLFGTRIRWGHTWTPGANMATRLDVSKDVTIEGRQVPKGAYSVWIVVTPGTWEMLLDRDTARFHTQPPKQGDAQVRFQVSREKSWTRPCIPLDLATATGYSCRGAAAGTGWVGCTRASSSRSSTSSPWSSTPAVTGRRPSRSGCLTMLSPARERECHNRT